MRADDHASSRQYYEHLRDASRDYWLGDIEGRTRLCLASPQRGPREQHADPEADDERHDGDPNRVHRKIVGVGSEPADQSIAAYALRASSVWYLFTLR